MEKKEFMLLFRLSPQMDQQPTPEEMNTQEQQWGNFIGQLAMQEKLISTYQLGFEGCILNANGQQTNGIYLENGQTIGGNIVLRCKDLEEVVEIAKDCPILSMGGNVEIREIQPMG